MENINRRNFIRTSVFGGVAVSIGNRINAFGLPGTEEKLPSSAVITTGNSRADMVFRALEPYSGEIRQAIGNRLVVLKPNNVAINVPLSATHVETLEGILEFLKSIKKLDNVIIAESAGTGPTLEGFSNFGYMSLPKKYPVKLVNLDTEGFEIMHVIDEKDFRPHPVRISKLISGKDSYVVSVARMKTHDRTVVTLSLKNIVFGAPIKDPDFTWGKSRTGGLRSDKPVVHGGGIKGINYNLFDLSRKIHPDLAVIDGFEGMEGNGPASGTAVDHRVCVASTDWLAADRVAVELMGVDFSMIGYLNYCAQAGLGTADLDKIRIIGENISDHRRVYRLHDSIQEQLLNKSPV